MLPKSLSTKSVQQNYCPELYPLYSPSCQKIFFLLLSWLWSPPCMDCSTPPPNQPFGRNPVDGGGEENPTQQHKKCSFPTPEKFLSPNSNFHVITQYKLHLQLLLLYLQSLLLYIFFLTLAFLCRYMMLILISQWLLNLI